MQERKKYGHCRSGLWAAWGRCCGLRPLEREVTSPRGRRPWACPRGAHRNQHVSCGNDSRSLHTPYGLGLPNRLRPCFNQVFGVLQRCRGSGSDLRHQRSPARLPWVLSAMFSSGNVLFIHANIPNMVLHAGTPRGCCAPRSAAPSPPQAAPRRTEVPARGHR